MSDNNPVVTGHAIESKSKKKRKNKKKALNTATETTHNTVAKDASNEATDTVPTVKAGAESDDSEVEHGESDTPQPTGPSTETSIDDEATTILTNGVDKVPSEENEEIAEPDAEDATARFDALVKERDTLRNEVTLLRQSLERLQEKHEEEMEHVRDELKESVEEKERAEEEYQNLLGKVNTIRSQLGERLKADAEELAQARTLIEELEEQKAELQEQYTVRSGELEELTSQNQAKDHELADLRSRSSLSQQNWIKERDELVESEMYIREEFENAKIAMHDWEVLATEERQIKLDLERRYGDLEDQLALVRADYERAADERNIQSSTVDGLQKALQEIQDARRKELREVVENSQSEVQHLQNQVEDFKKANTALNTDLQETKTELERTAPFEKEVKEKNLLLGKLRHETAMLGDHLTKALRVMKKGRSEDNVDRQVMSNLLIQFLSYDRSDPKKFQVLQVFAGMLDWSEEQKQQVGLARPGGSSASTTGSLRLPKASSIHRAPSTPSLAGSDYFGADSALSPGSTGRESLAELWQNFLEQEAGSSYGGKGSVSSHSRRESTNSAATQSTSKG